MAKKNDSGKGGLTWAGVGDSRPGSSTEPEKGQGAGGTPTVDFHGVPDSRPSSSTKSQSVKIGGGE